MFLPHPLSRRFPISRGLRRAVGLIAVALCIGIALPGSAEAATQSGPNRWESLRAADLRVATVSYRLSVANRALCSTRAGPRLGFVIHGIEQYGMKDRAGARQNYGLGSHSAVLAVVAGSPAERAGLAPDDALVSVNGRLLDSDAGAGPPTSDRTDRAQAAITLAAKTGPVTLGVLRAGRPIAIVFGAASGCRSDVALVPDQRVNAWADGESVIVAGGLLARCRTDDELAIVIGHEMAHNILGHARPAASDARPGHGNVEMRATEEGADALAIRLSAAAAFDLRGAVSFLGGLLANVDAPRADDTHPDTKRRLALMSAAILQI